MKRSTINKLMYAIACLGGSVCASAAAVACAPEGERVRDGALMFVICLVAFALGALVDSRVRK